MSGDWHVDAQLLEAWRGGDNQAGEQLFDRHAPAVTRFFRNKVREEVEDLVQQTFLALVSSKERIREGVAFRGYVLGIARNILGKHLRKLSRGRAVDPEVETMATLAPGPSTLAGKKQEHRLLLEALRRLPIEHQVALELFYWEGLKGKEIAEVVGVSHSALRGRLSKARELLEASMKSIAASPELLRSTVDGLEQWAEDLRGRLG